MKNRLLILSLFLTLSNVSFSQILFDFEGNGNIAHDDTTRLTVKSLNSNNSLIRFGSDDVSKFSLGYNSTKDIMQLCAGTSLTSDAFTMGIGSFTNRFALNSIPSTHRFLIRHNSTSGTTGSAHLTIQETVGTDFGRLRFENENQDGQWVVAARSTNGESLLNFFYNDGLNFANVLSMDGDLFRVGIHQTEPEAYLHIKQQTAGVDVLKFENDDQTGGEIWGWRVGDNDILIYFEGGIRGSFNSDDGVYTNFPPPPPAESHVYKSKEKELMKQFRQIESKVYRNKSGRQNHVLDPYQIQKVNNDWVVYSEDNANLGINHEQMIALSIEAIKEQQNIIEDQAERINKMEKLQEEMISRLLRLEQD